MTSNGRISVVQVSHMSRTRVRNWRMASEPSVTTRYSDALSLCMILHTGLYPRVSNVGIHDDELNWELNFNLKYRFHVLAYAALYVRI